MPLTMIVMAILTVLALSVVSKARYSLNETMARKDEFSDFLAINSAFQQTLLVLTAGRFEHNRVILGDINLPLDGRPVDFNGTVVAVQDFAGLANLVKATRGDFTNIFGLYTDTSTAQKIATDIDNWRNFDGASSPTSGSADIYVPRHSPMRSLDELLEIPGITGELYNGTSATAKSNVQGMGIRDLLLVGGVGWYNFATMPEPLIRAFAGGGSNTISKLVTAREKAQWSEVKSLLTSMGVASELMMEPSSRFLIKMQAKHYKARAQVEVLIANSPLYKKTLWQFPDAARY